MILMIKDLHQLSEWEYNESSYWSMILMTKNLYQLSEWEYNESSC